MVFNLLVLAILQAAVWIGVEHQQGKGCVEILRVSPGGPAAKAGLNTGDCIMAVNKSGTRTIKEFVAALSALSPNVPASFRLTSQHTRIVKPLVWSEELEIAFCEYLSSVRTVVLVFFPGEGTEEFRRLEFSSAPTLRAVRVRSGARGRANVFEYGCRHKGAPIEHSDPPEDTVIHDGAVVNVYSPDKVNQIVFDDPDTGMRYTTDGGKPGHQ